MNQGTLDWCKKLSRSDLETGAARQLNHGGGEAEKFHRDFGLARQNVIREELVSPLEIEPGGLPESDLLNLSDVCVPVMVF